MEKRFFAGNNTSVGFYSYFDYIVRPEEADRIYILKGGPGVGKSSFMKRLAKFFYEKGADIEYIHCSTDYNSLDGIYLPKYKLAVVDGTSPHTRDPELPGLVEEILDFGKFLNRDLLLENRGEIIKINKEKANLYKRGYHYLEMAGIMLHETSTIYSEIMDTSTVYNLNMNLVADLDKIISKYKINRSKGRIRKMFADSYTPNGYVSFVDKLCYSKDTWKIISPDYKHVSQLLDHLVAKLLMYGFNVEGYYMPLFPEKLQHIYIKELNLMIISGNSKDYETIEAASIYEFQNSIDKEKYNSYKLEIDDNNKLLNSLLEKGMNKFKEAKSKHEVLERIYVKSMDFNKVNLVYDDITANY